MYGFIRRFSKFEITLSLIVLSLALCQISGRTDLSSSNRQSGGASGSEESSQPDATVLAPGESIDQALPEGGSHSYKITLNSGQFLRLLITPSGTGLSATLHAPDGQKLSQSTCREDGPRPVSAIAEVSGTYRLEVRSLENDPALGRYQVKVEEVRPATALDTHRVAAEQAFAEAEELRNEWKAESSRKAIESYEEALQHWRTAGERIQEASSLRKIGEIYHVLGEPQRALNPYQQALAISRKANDPKGEAETLNDMADVLLPLGEKQRAMESCSRALNLSRTNGDRQGEAQSLRCIGKVHYAGFGNLRKSLEYFDQTLAGSYPLSDRRGQAEALYYSGWVSSELGEVQKASDFHNRALILFRSLGDRRGEALTLIASGDLHSWLGERQQAFDLLNRALALVRSMGDKRWEPTILAKLGWALFKMGGEIQRSLDYYRDGLRLYQAANIRPGEAALLSDMGEIYYSSGQKQKALDHYYRALLLSRTVGLTYESSVLRNMGVVYESLGQKAEALTYYKQALSLNRACGDRRNEAITLNNLGRLYQGLGQVSKSVDYCHRALLLTRETQDRVVEALALHNLARAERSRGNLTEARSQLEEALKIIESLRTKVASQELRSSYFASEHQHYDFYIDLLMQMHKKRPSEGMAADALQASERARARSLLDSLAEARADIRQGIDPTLLDRERSLQQGLTAKANRQVQLLSGKPNKEETEVLAREIRNLRNEFDQLQAEIKSKSPRYAALTQPQPLGLQEIQQQVLDNKTLLLEYALGDERSYLWAVTPNTITSHELPGRAKIEDAARQLYGLLTARQRKPTETFQQHQARVTQADSEYWRKAASLSAVLLGPVADQLGTRRLLIVAEGGLLYLPFGALPTPKARGDRGKATSESGKDDPTPLFADHEIVPLPSASVMAVLRRDTRDRQRPKKAVAVIADPVFDSDDPRLNGGIGTQRQGDTLTKEQTKGQNTSLLKALVPAATALRMPHPARISNSLLPIGVIPPRPFTEGQLAVRGVGISLDGPSFPRLLSTRREAEAIMSVAPPGTKMQAVDFEASRATATSPELGQYRIVHFATHGVLYSEHPELSGLVLSLVDKQGKPQDGFLRLHDIYNLNLPIDLVVLSACNTGLGKDVRGEGLVGIVRGFMYAGAARVVASLWNVDDDATAELMKRFYRHMLQDNMPAAAALRAAQVEMWQQKQWRSPYYWAAFVLQGEWK